MVEQAERDRSTLEYLVNALVRDPSAWEALTAQVLGGTPGPSSWLQDHAVIVRDVFFAAKPKPGAARSAVLSQLRGIMDGLRVIVGATAEQRLVLRIITCHFEMIWSERASA